MTYKKIAGAFLCFNRPDYTERVIKSLERAKESHEIDWFVFQDGMENKISGNIYGTEEDILKVRKVIEKSTLPIKHYKQNNSNVSIGQQKHKAHRLFNDYDLIYFFEDDLVISKYYIRLLRVMAEQFPDYIGMMNTHPSTKKARLNHVRRCGIARTWGYYMNRKVFNKIKDEYERFNTEISKIDYNIKWQTPGVRKIVQFPWKCHDITITNLTKKVGAFKYWPKVTRGIYIGEVGAIAYRDKKKFERKGFHSQPTEREINNYKGDATLKEFVLK